MHDTYVVEQRRQGATVDTNPSLVSWDELPESLKQSNRDQAAHIEVKMNAADCDLAPLAGGTTDHFRFDDNEIERLAELEHERWTSDNARRGWTYGPEKDAQKKVSPNMVPWSELRDDIREYDRIFVRALPGLLAEAGYRIVRRSGD